jgi:PAS domain S-box-containing protein
MRSHLLGAGLQLFLRTPQIGSSLSGRDFAKRRCTRHDILKLCLPWALPTLVIALLIISPLQPIEAAPVKQVRRVLILYEVGNSHPGVTLIDQGIRAAVDNSPYQLEFYREYMETVLFPDPADQQQFRDSFLAKYRNRKPDVIITVGPSPLKLLAETHETFFPGVPVIFAFPNRLAPGSPILDSHFAGVQDAIQAAGTVDLALRLRPDCQHVVVVGGTSNFDKQVDVAAREQLRRYEGRLDVSYLMNNDMPGLLEQVKHLPDHTILLFLSFSQDAAGTHFLSGTQAAPMIVAASNAPVFSVFDVHLNHGEVGGRMSSLFRDGEIAGHMAVRALNGENTQDISVVISPTVDIFDWRALRRWRLKETNLPPGSTILNRQPTLWESFRWYVIGGMALILVEALLISGLFWQRIRRKAAETKLIIANKQLESDIVDRKRAEATLHESEERFRLVANTAPVMIWMPDQDKLWTYFNQSWLEFTGQSLEAEIGKGWAERGIHSEDLQQCIDFYTRAFDRRETFEMQYRLRRHDGEYMWIFDQGVPRFNADGSFAGYIGSCIDITERKLAEETLAGMSRKLLEAQEQERRRIARELHDDINQRLALLSIEIDRMKEVSPATYGELRSRMDELGEQTSDISSVIQSLSHELHSSKLEYLGLVSAMRGFCREFGDKHNVKIDFISEGMPATVPQEISICLFRVTQAGLQNALKHSGVRFFEVTLYGSASEIQLVVRDSGVGFDPELTRATEGLGLVSMHERVRLVKGTISITSKPQSGTEVSVRVPLPAAVKVERVKATGA